MTGAVERLRATTRPLHDAVDAAFGGHDLTDRDHYARFLRAHGRALPAAEAALKARPDLPAWRERTALLTADLAELGAALPPALPFALPAAPGADWGALYVIEGSRLGGVMLARDVPAGWPVRYLGARHRPGEWRALLQAIEARGGDAAWMAALVEGAEATFALYRRAVD